MMLSTVISTGAAAAGFDGGAAGACVWADGTASDSAASQTAATPIRNRFIDFGSS